MLKHLRVVLQVFSIICLTLLFLDFTGTLQPWFGWLAKIQLLPAALTHPAPFILLFLFLATLVFGRLYCSLVCPMGIVQDFFNWLGMKRSRNHFHYSSENRWLRFIVLAVKNKTDDFYKNELSIRELLGFPPFVRLLRLVFRSQNKNSTELACNGAYNILKHSCPSTVQILGPAECPLEKINNNYRMQLLLRGQNISEMQKMTSSFIWGYKAPNDVYIEVDVDPVSLL